MIAKDENLEKRVLALFGLYPDLSEEEFSRRRDALPEGGVFLMGRAKRCQSRSKEVLKKELSRLDLQSGAGVEERKDNF